MRRLTLLMSLVLLLGSVLVIGSRVVGAQDDELSTADHPLVGAWQVDADLASSDTSVESVLFHDDGTLVDLQLGEEGQEIFLGVWQPTGERTADVTFSQVIPNDDGTLGTGHVRAALEVSEDGNSFSGQYTLEFSGVAGFEAEGEYGPEAVEGVRITVEPMGTPVGSLSDLFGQFEEGTPEATPAA